ncbi:MAG TPA: cyclic nucleotide-binding domain-containing protein [Phycicoccus sp.]|nr:cyclic nucleotide-binding domain-containing protein [Phycicoccus sp.]
MTMTVVERVVALHDVPLFAAVPGRTLAAVAARAVEVPVRAGDVVIAEGSVEDHLFVVVRGRLRAAHDGVVLRDLPAGSTVGELAALVPEPRSATVTALEPTLLLRIDKPVLDELLADRPELTSGVIGTLVAMLRGGAAARDGRAR